MIAGPPVRYRYIQWTQKKSSNIYPVSLSLQACTFRIANDIFDFGEILVLNEHNLEMIIKVEKTNKCYKDLVDADFESRNYMVSCIKSWMLYLKHKYYVIV
jgi:hypothetical protein